VLSFRSEAWEALAVKRREFIALLGGVAAWPFAAWAQQPERMRRIGVLLNITADDPQSQARLAAFAQGLQQLGWTIGQNVLVALTAACKEDPEYATH
jgi:putative tryptophan/tyrosine transport system substrate-binding protein